MQNSYYFRLQKKMNLINLEILKMCTSKYNFSIFGVLNDNNRMHVVLGSWNGQEGSNENEIVQWQRQK